MNNTKKLKRERLMRPQTYLKSRSNWRHH